MIDRKQLRTDGYVLLRQAIPADWLADLRGIFDAGVLPSDQWPVPRGWDWRHSLLDHDALIHEVCRLPQVLAAVGDLIAERFFLVQVEGREPVAGAGHQRLHRDGAGQRPGDTVSALAFFDDYGPDNGATRVVPGSCRPLPGEPPFNFDDESRSVQLSGSAGDILVFDVDLVHGGSRNISGARRRSILFSYASQQLHDGYERTKALRGVRMATSERFEPPQGSAAD